MKFKPNIFVLATTLALMLTPNIQAQTLNPPYLNEFPSVERVKAETKGTDTLDTTARQMSAFYHLLWVIKELAGTRYDRFSSDGGPKVTPDEKRLYATYGGEWTRLYNSPLSPKDKERLMNLHGSYIVGGDLRDELLRRLFSPDFRASYYRATGEQPPPSDSRVPASTATGSTDGTDIVKAKAAKVDIRVFGMQLGDPFRLSKCPLVGIDFISDKHYCPVQEFSARFKYM
jgi:hypothetical protein